MSQRTLNVHVYPVFRVELVGMHGEVGEVVEAAEHAVLTACTAMKPMAIEVPGHGWRQMHFADGCGDAALVDVMEGPRRVESSTHSAMYEQAKEHAATLESLIDGENDEFGELLMPIKRFLEQVR